MTAAPGPQQPDEVRALHRIDQLIGNQLTISAEVLGEVRGIVLDTLNAWHQAHLAASSAQPEPPTLNSYVNVSVCQGGDEPFELHQRYCVPLAEQLAAARPVRDTGEGRRG